MVEKLPDHVDSLTQFLRLPEFKPAFEFVAGRVIQKMSPKYSHSLIQTELATVLNGFARPSRLGRAFTELRSTFGGQSIVFDVSFFVTARLPKFTRGTDEPRFLIPPDIAVEILSPGQSVRELVQRLRFALRHGSSSGWLIRPRHEDVRIYRPGQEQEILREGDFLTGEPVLPGFALPIADLFGWLDQD